MNLCLISILEEIQEVLLYFPQIKDIRASAKIDDLRLVKDIAAKCGFKVRNVAQKSDDEPESVSEFSIDKVVFDYFILCYIERIDSN